MAVRIENLTKHPLRLDLRGGATLLVPPGTTTGPVRVEDLYDNPYLAEWRGKGWIAEHTVKYDVLLAHEAAQGAPVASEGRPQKARKRRPPAKRGRTR